MSVTQPDLLRDPADPGRPVTLPTPRDPTDMNVFSKSAAVAAAVVLVIVAVGGGPAHALTLHEGGAPPPTRADGERIITGEAPAPPADPLSHAVDTAGVAVAAFTAG